MDKAFYKKCVASFKSVTEHEIKSRTQFRIVIHAIAFCSVCARAFYVNFEFVNTGKR